MQSPAHELAKYLASQGVATWAAQTGWAISFSREPERPDTTITLYDTGGFGPIDDDQNFFNSTIQVRVRSRDYAAAYAKHEEIRTWLVVPTTFVGETTRFCGVSMVSDILSLGRDDNDRHLLTANYQCLRQAI